MKNSFYFDHDYNSRNDQKILEVRAEFGWEGYAIFFSLLECLCESKGYIKREALAGLSLGLSMPKEMLLKYIDFFIKIELFHENKNGIFSDRILTHLAYREKLSVSGSKGGRGNKKPPFSHPLAPLEAGKESKGEESKEEYSKEEYSKENINKYDFSNFKNEKHFNEWIGERINTDYKEFLCRQTGLNLTEIEIKINEWKDICINTGKIYELGDIEAKSYLLNWINKNKPKIKQTDEELKAEIRNELIKRRNAKHIN